MQQRLGDNVGQLLDPNHASMLKAGAAGGQPQGYFFFRGHSYQVVLRVYICNLSNLKVGKLLFCRQTLHGTPGGISGNLQQVQNRSQQLPGPIQVIIIIIIVIIAIILLLSYLNFLIFYILVC